MQNRREFLQSLVVGGAAFSAFPHLSFAQTETGAWKTDYPKILKRIKPPKFKKKVYLITKFGAVGDGKTLNTEAIKSAIAECHKNGGGRVVVPEGEFITGAIHLKSNVNLHLLEGSTLKFSTDSKDYLPLVFTRWEGMELTHISPLIYAYEQTNIGITGKGTLDGQGKAEFWKWHGNPRYGGDPSIKSQRPDRDKLYDMMTRNVPVAERIFGEKSWLRPQFIQPYKCKNILIDGVKIIDSPMWEVHPVLCENVTVRRLTIISHGPNNDGCNPESSKDVLIENCYFDTGDDCIAIKSGRNNDGRRIGVASENIIVRNCNFKDGHGGITVGSECSGGFRNLFAENNKLDSPDLWTALRIKNNASRGGKIENLYFRNITVGKVSRSAIEMDFNYEEGSKGEHTPIVRNFVVENLTVQDCNKAVDLQGLDKAPLYDILLKNCDFGKVTGTNIVKNVKNLKLENVKMNGKVTDKL
jgi:polygalacturonase